MRKILLLMFMCVCVGVSAQRVDKPGEGYDAYCYLRTYGLKPHNGEVYFPEKKAPIKLVDENGKSVKFRYEVDAINYMSKRGWRYVESHKDETVSFVQWFLFVKNITSDEEMFVGLYLNEKGKDD